MISMRNRKGFLAAVGSVVLLMAACVESPESASESQNNEPAESNNTSVDPNCEVLAMCPADACGEVDDGCGGTIECTEGCACDGSTVEIDSCGTCGLGITRCDGTPQGSCEMPLRLTEALGELTQADCASRVIYVDTARASSGDGSREAPKADLQQALDDASPGSVIAISGSPSIDVEIELRHGVSILGGFTRQFERNETMRPTLAGGVVAVDINSTTVLSRLDVRTPDKTTPEESVAFFASNATGLVLEHMDVQSGQGGPGARGADGTSGKRGNDGESGKGGRAYDIVQGNEVLPSGAAGDGGAAVLCADGATTESGGKGGQGEGLLRSSTQSGSFPPASDGRDTTEAEGGQVEGPKDGESPELDDMRAPNARNADAADVVAEFDMGEWRVISVGGIADSGEAGSHGLGGAGGAGAKSPPIAPDRCGGAGGSGGGSGGCGGTEGLGGGPGWPSVALFVVESNGLTLHEVSIQSGKGGRGGDGGLGGLGGPGGLGADATLHCADGSQTSTRPGAGGDGTQGQDGGSGGGGSGGGSVGILCVDSILEDPESTLTITQGQPGRGGSGAMGEGEVGKSWLMEGCQIQ